MYHTHALSAAQKKISLFVELLVVNHGIDNKANSQKKYIISRFL